MVGQLGRGSFDFKHRFCWLRPTPTRRLVLHDVRKEPILLVLADREQPQFGVPDDFGVVQFATSTCGAYFLLGELVFTGRLPHPHIHATNRSFCTLSPPLLSLCLEITQVATRTHCVVFGASLGPQPETTNKREFIIITVIRDC